MSDYVGSDNFPYAVQLIADTDTPNASNLNPAPEGIADRTVNLNVRALMQATNMQAMTAWPFTVSSAPAYDSYKGRWLAAETSTHLVKYTFDNIAWHTLGSALSADADSFMGRPTDGRVFAFKSQNSTMAMLDPVTDTWSQYTGPSLSATGHIYGGYFAGCSNDGFIAIQTVPSAAVREYTNNLGGAGWNSDQGSQFPALFGSNGATQYVISIAKSASLFLAFTSSPEYASYVSTTDGVTFTTRTMPTLLTGESVVGACYNATLGLYMFSVATTTTTRIFTSTTGIGSWTLSVTLNTGSQSLVAVNSGSGTTLLAACIYISVLTAFRVCVSADFGATWHPARLESFNTIGSRDGIVGADASFMYADATSYSASHIFGVPQALAL